MTLKSVSFVFPMFNEADNIAETIRRATELAVQISSDYEIVVADDASTDGSGRLVDLMALKDQHIKSVHLKVNSKFGGALNTGLMAATKDVVIYTDSDFPAKEQDIKKAMEFLDEADIITAYSLVIKDSKLRRILMSKVYNLLVQSLFNLHLKDINSGLKIYKREVLNGLALKSRSPFIDVEIFAEAVRRGFRIKQYGLIFEHRTKGSSTISRMSVVARTFFDMFSYRLGRKGQ
ncbi:MAG: glycosyltransferase family 2 protein [Candidatus Omnitrophica bacterium]|nr:glycosyltransferase family 2 protein [Candidatus Omnitrophota bacterium]MBU0880607.1 glycosyltransferase family 2 protein [Candidatus Omnitrophota bacterium]MBU0895849.1 glycosyltransferase family 2 protein [Candidatus Omnitrophota bacterium]MBU1809405.1 glycosyltransferase family 2 protein [Candidatus Omnitrophota bacterium]